MIIRSKAPLRLGFAGGGTDVSPFSDLYGGAILNATITMYAYATIQPRKDNKIVFNSIDKNQRIEFDAAPVLPLDGELDLIKGIYNRVVKDFSREPLAFELTTHVDAPPGSGLGTSSTLVVAILGAFSEWLQLPLGEYDLAHLAYEIERVDLDMAGGKQDQYAATFGGVNFMEFFKEDKVIVNPLRVKPVHMAELSHNLILFNLETSRLSSEIIEMQKSNVNENKLDTIEAMKKLKEQSVMMKEALLKGKVDEIGRILDYGWKYKKQMATGISNPYIDELYDAVIKSGATGGKISGAGGGGFIFFYCPNNTKFKVIKTLSNYQGSVTNYDFTSEGLTTWII